MKKTKKVNFFLSNSRLTRKQRKYCHCLMKARTAKESPYKKCNYFVKIDKTKTNCFLNYDFENYSLEEIRLLCKEKKIKTFYMKNKKKVNYKKKGLINRLLENYFKKKKSKSFKKLN